MGHTASPPRPELLALLRQVKATPEDEALRLVLADWLEEHGDAADRARAALIRTDAEWRGRPAPGHDETQQRLREQMQALERAYGSEWLGPLRQSNVQCQFHRGLIHVETNVGVVAAWRNRAWPQTEAWAWVERARLVNGTPADIAKLAESPALGSLATLELSAARSPGAAAALAQSPHLANLSRLEVTRLGAPGAGAVAVARSPHLGRLTALGLIGNGLRNEHVLELLEAPCLGQLTDLGLTGNSFSDEAVRALANCPRLANLKKLRLLYNEHLRDPALVTLAASPYLDNLEHLECAGRVNADDAQAFLDSPHLPRLRYVHGMWFDHLPAPLRERMRERFG
jgi:uncharacterized protein (TIGR02996 family)